VGDSKLTSAIYRVFFEFAQVDKLSCVKQCNNDTWGSPLRCIEHTGGHDWETHRAEVQDT